MSIESMKDILWFMELAYEEAYIAAQKSEVPVGAIVVSPDGKLISKAHNRKEMDNDPTGHAELIAIREACRIQNNWRLSGCSLFVTLEPCPMCLSAIAQSRVSSLYFAAYDKKGGSISLGYSFQKDRRLNHEFKVVGGVEHFKNSQLLSKFFKERRKLRS